MNIQKLRGNALNGILPDKGIFVGNLIDQRAIATNTDFINVGHLPQGCDCFIGNPNFDNTQICIVPQNSNNLIVTNGMNGCALYIYKANNHYIFFHNWNNSQLASISKKANAKADKDNIPQWEPLQESMEPIHIIKFENYSIKMRSRANNRNIFCFIPLVLPFNANQLSIYFLFFERKFFNEAGEYNPTAPWLYDKSQSYLMNLFV